MTTPSRDAIAFILHCTAESDDKQPTLLQLQCTMGCTVYLTLNAVTLADIVTVTVDRGSLTPTLPPPSSPSPYQHHQQCSLFISHITSSFGAVTVHTTKKRACTTCTCTYMHSRAATDPADPDPDPDLLTTRIEIFRSGSVKKIRMFSKFSTTFKI